MSADLIRTLRDELQALQDHVGGEFPAARAAVTAADAWLAEPKPVEGDPSGHRVVFDADQLVGGCGQCELPPNRCIYAPCSASERPERRPVHYIKVGT